MDVPAKKKEIIMGKLRVLRIFKKKSISDHIESLEDKIEESYKPTKLEIAANYFTIFGTAVSLIIAVWGIFLTKKFGESQDQINALKGVIYQQQEQNKTLVDILEKIELQNSSMQNQITELSIIEKGTIQQNELIKKDIQESQAISKNISSQLQINRKFETIQDTELSNKKRSDSLQLVLTYTEIRDSLAFYRLQLQPWERKTADESYRKDWIERTKKMIEKTISLLYRELNNELLLSNDSLNYIWKQCIEDINSAGSLFYYSDPRTYDGMFEIYKKIIDASKSFWEFNNKLNPSSK